MIVQLFDQALELQGKRNYKVWDQTDREALVRDIENGLQYKIVAGANVLSIFSVQFADPHIWESRDQNNAVYLHRIVVNKKFRGQKQFQKILDWATSFAQQNRFRFIRMDTWADNRQLIAYYKTFGFVVIGNVTTPDSAELPIQNRNLTVALLELEVGG